MNSTASSLALESEFNEDAARQTEINATHMVLSDIEMLFNESQDTGLPALLPKLVAGLTGGLAGKTGELLGTHATAMVDFFHSRSAKLRCIQSAVNVALGEDVSEISALTALRDESIPGYLRSLDQLAYDLSAGMNGSGCDLFVPLASAPGAARAIALSANPASMAKFATDAVGGNSTKLAQSTNALMEQYRSLIYSIGSDAAVADLTARENEAFVQQRENRRLSTSDVSAGEVSKMQQFKRAHEASTEVERAIDELLQITLTIGV